jgi:hypothetical protein
MTKNNLDQALSVQVFEEGQALCQDSYIDCSSYHFMRPILRRIDAVPSSYSHADFYTSAIENALADCDEARVTVSGTADYSWVLSDSPLLKGLGNSGTLAQIQVVDGCSTPTSFSMQASNELDQHMVAVNTQNITEFLFDDKASDLIITDAFLTQFATKRDRLAVLARWRQSLKLGGHIVTTAQIAREQNSIERPKAESTFINNTAALYAQSDYPDILKIDTEEFTKRIRAYASPNASRIYESERELTAEIVEAGLKVIDVTPMNVYSQSSEKTLSYRGLILTALPRKS